MFYKKQKLVLEREYKVALETYANGENNSDGGRRGRSEVKHVEYKLAAIRDKELMWNQFTAIVVSSMLTLLIRSVFG